MRRLLILLTVTTVIYSCSKDVSCETNCKIQPKQPYYDSVVLDTTFLGNGNDMYSHFFNQSLTTPDSIVCQLRVYLSSQDSVNLVRQDQFYFYDGYGNYVQMPFEEVVVNNTASLRFRYPLGNTLYSLFTGSGTIKFNYVSETSAPINDSVILSLIYLYKHD